MMNDDIKEYIKDLQQRIDKAIKIINEYAKQNYSEYPENEIEIGLIEEIEHILKGEKQ